MSVAIIIPVVITFAIRLARLGYDEAFRQVSPTQFAGLLLVIPIGAALLALPIAYAFKLASITLSDDTITGRNYWGMKRSIPLADVVALENFSNNGIDAIAVKSRSHGTVYISVHTEHMDGLMELLQAYLPDNSHNQNPLTEPSKPA